MKNKNNLVSTLLLGGFLALAPCKKMPASNPADITLFNRSFKDPFLGILYNPNNAQTGILVLPRENGKMTETAYLLVSSEKKKGTNLVQGNYVLTRDGLSVGVQPTLKSNGEKYLPLETTASIDISNKNAGLATKLNMNDFDKSCFAARFNWKDFTFYLSSDRERKPPFGINLSKFLSVDLAYNQKEKSKYLEISRGISMKQGKTTVALRVINKKNFGTEYWGKLVLALSKN